MNNLLLRAVSGSVYVAVILLCIFGGPRWFTLLMGVFGVIGINEVVRMLTKGQNRNLVAEYADLLFYASVLLLTFGLSGVYSEVFFIIFLTLTILYFPVRMLIAVCQKSENALTQTKAAFFGLLYVGTPLLMASVGYNLFGNNSNSLAVKVMLISFVLIWLNDTGAYLTGCNFGRHKLCERLSPKKTWEGFFGGFALCVIAAVVYAIFEGYDVLVLGIYGALVSVAATFGDLFESLIKRRCGVKDSGNLIPGHGGILDRIDSFLAVAPLALLFILVYVFLF